MSLFLHASHFLWHGETNKVHWWLTIWDWCGLLLERGKCHLWKCLGGKGGESQSSFVHFMCVRVFYKIHFNVVGWFSILHVYSTVFCRKYRQFFLGKGSSHGAVSPSHPWPCVCTGCTTAGHWAIQLTSTFMHSLLAYILNQHNYTNILVTTWRFTHTHTLTS